MQKFQYTFEKCKQSFINDCASSEYCSSLGQFPTPSAK